ncbi:PREDICTED: uncharacterized protein LOC100633155 isoform X2 [Amphimedon queenslandica]|uniref:Uncharacterized protein n=2 Tax=Amphimedon queenslandica TaxID=400682 RepID=A0AAN0IWP6_AMPQE|nr:PREDICTED: uncharacterized protein LOC100633155 isoform X2 [Amphimedon queenslandica]|eukprot:XP_019849205.1 PREDICTED: uncharacterized protein LOC100633155 isoform X2 [Amphimedon queenslandica]
MPISQATTMSNMDLIDLVPTPPKPSRFIIEVWPMASDVGGLLGPQRRPSSRYLRSRYVATLGSSLSAKDKSNGSDNASIALEPFVQNDTETDGVHGTRYRQIVDENFETVSFADVETAEQEEFKFLLKKELSAKRACLHKGLLSNIIFFTILVVGVILMEISFPSQGPRSYINNNNNNSKCEDNLGVCIPLRSLRSFGFFGLAIGIINWLFIELLFRKVLCVFGSGLIQKHYGEIINGFRDVIVDVIFDTEQLQSFFTEKDERIRKILKLESRVSGLLDSDAAQKVIDSKIDSILASPQGMHLLMMNVDEEKVRRMLQVNIRTFIDNVSPMIYKRLVAPGISDAQSLKSEITYILEPKITQLMPKDVNKIVAAMIHKHLSWLIIWGNLFGGLVGFVNEIIILIALLIVKE